MDDSDSRPAGGLLRAIGKAIRVVVALGVLGLCGLVTAPTWMRAQRDRRFGAADHPAVMSACQTLMAAHPPDAPPREVQAGGPGFGDLPPALLALEPSSVTIGSAQVVIRGDGPALTAQRARADLGAGPFRREVVPGLWLDTPD